MRWRDARACVRLRPATPVGPWERTFSNIGYGVRKPNAMSDKILFVDDDAIALEGFKVVMGRMFDATYAREPEQALGIVDADGPFAVIVADLKMPGLNGVQFFSRVRERHPETIRIMLTGVRDMDAAMSAINDGEVYRFYIKPCKPELLRAAVRSGIAKYRSSLREATETNPLSVDALFQRLEKILASSTQHALEARGAYHLSQKELHIACAVCAGASTKEIAASLRISSRTVESHRKNIRMKFHIANRKITLQAFLLSLLDDDAFDA